MYSVAKLSAHAHLLPTESARIATSLQSGGSPKIRALLPVHLHGQCADMDALLELAQEFKLIIIEDAAQAIAAKWRDRNAGSLGIATTFSFYPTKV